jgi:HEAT repeat protein
MGLFQNTTFREKVLLLRVGIAAVIGVPLAIIVLVNVGRLQKNHEPETERPKNHSQLQVQLRSEDSNSRNQALTELATLRPITTDIFVAVVARLGDHVPEVRRNAADTLSKIATIALPRKNDWPELLETLTKALNDVDLKVVGVATDMLPQIGPSAKAALPELRKQLKSAVLTTRLAAAGTIIRIDKDTYAELSPMLRDNLVVDSVSREDAAKITGKLGESAKDMGPALLQLLNDDSDPSVRVQAGIAFTKVAPGDARKAVPGLVELVASLDKQTGGKLKMPKLGGNSGGPVVISLEALKSPLAKVRVSAVELIRELDMDAAEKIDR